MTLLYASALRYLLQDQRLQIASPLASALSVLDYVNHPWPLDLIRYARTPFREAICIKIL